tara:strand:+ start:194 stop:1450 length:1257 start_codon:yes stop_codon:yes gene_type:complete
MPIVSEQSVLGSNKDEAYLYLFKNLFNLKKYIGVHKGAPNDEYLHSSTSQEFKEALQKDDFSYEILAYGSYKEMCQREHAMLLEVDAKNNDEYYNLSNGFSQYDEPDFDKVKDLFNQIKDGFYQKRKEPLNIHELMDYLQVRFQHHGDHQRNIKECIDVVNGDTDNCFGKGKGLLVVVFEGRGKKGTDLRIDGSHSVNAAVSSKHATTISAIRIPFEVNSDFTEAEIRMLGNLLNKRDDIEKKSMSEKDAIKYVIDNVASGIEWNSNINAKALKSFGFKGNIGRGKIKSIITKAKQIIDVQRNKLEKGLLWIDYTAMPHKNTLSDVEKFYSNQDGWCSMSMSSGYYRLDRIMQFLRNQNKLDPNIKSCMVIIHHPNTRTRNEWDNGFYTEWKKIQDMFMLNSGFFIDYKVMDVWTSDS